MTFTYDLWSRYQNKIAVALLGAAAIGMTGPSQAQVPGGVGQGGSLAPLPVPPGGPLGGGNASFFGTDAGAASGNAPGNAPDQEATTVPRRPWSIVPRITVGETFTNNVAPTSGVKRSDQVTELSPGVRVDADTARVKFHLDYQLRQLLYAQDSKAQNTQNYLNSFGTLEAIDKWLFVDVSGVIAQQEISPFSFQSASNVTVNPNRIETSSFRVSPYIRGRLGGAADYEVRYNRTTTQGNSAFMANVDTEEWSGALKGTTPLAAVNWGLEANHRNIDYTGGRNNDADLFRGRLAYKFDPEFKVSVSGGQESNNFASANRQTSDIYGYGFDWQPSERTQVSAFREKRFFGYGHNVSVSHRTPLSALRFTDTQDVAILPNRFNTVGFGSIYDLLFSQMTSSIPDPIERGRYVDTLLQQFGISPDVLVTRGFFTSRASQERRQELSYSLQGARNILTLSAGRTENRAIGPAAGANDIFAVAQNIRQRGFSVNFGHRVTPLTTFNAIASRQDSTGTNGANLSSELRALQLSLTTQLGPKTAASVGVRRALFDSNLVRPYGESALIGTFTAQF